MEHMNTLEIYTRNIGGIDELTLDLDAETVVVSGRNASNKTSLLKSIAFGLGVRNVPMRNGADEAQVKLTIDGTTVEREATRTENGVRRRGTGWVDEEEALLLERFATLLETNELRAAVATGGDVESLLKEPMDIEPLKDRQSRLMDERRQLEADLESLDDVAQRLAEREQELEGKREQVRALEDQVDELYEEQESVETDDEELQSLRERRADLRSKRDRFEAQREDTAGAVARLEEELADLADDIEAAEAVTEAYDVDTLKREREEIRSELSDVTERVEVLQSVLTANREMLDSEFTGVLGQETGLMGDEVTCWACGESAEREQFDGTVERLGELIEQDKKREREREPEIESLTERIEEAKATQGELDDLRSRRHDVEQKLETRLESLERKKEQLAEIRDELETVDAEIADHETEQNSEQSDIASEIEETRVKLQTLRREAERLNGIRADLHTKRDERDSKRERVEELTEEIQELTDRIENLEKDLRETFNEAMDDLIGYLEFERIDRVWLDGNFDLVIVREIDGTTRRDSLEHLAESEREMIGLVLGLAGFVAFDVAEVTPVLLLDSLGAFDTERTERLIDYFAERTDILLAAAHPEMAAAFDFETVTFEAPSTA